MNFAWLKHSLKLEEFPDFDQGLAVQRISEQAKESDQDFNANTNLDSFWYLIVTKISICYRIVFILLTMACFSTHSQIIHKLLLKAVVLNWYPGFIVALEEQVDSSVPGEEEERVKRQQEITICIHKCK